MGKPSGMRDALLRSSSLLGPKNGENDAPQEEARPATSVAPAAPPAADQSPPSQAQKRPEPRATKEKPEEAEEPAAEEKLLKITFYLREDQPLALEEEKLRRRRKGQKVGVSELVREALDLAYPPQK